MKTNYHTHTTRCNHATGSDEDYVISAIKAGFDEIGFSDHCPWLFDDNYKSHMRMTISEFDDYKQSVKALQVKYKDQISIKLGLEVEYFERYIPWMKKFIKEEELDYVIFGNHFYDSEDYGFYYGSQIKDAKTMNLYVEDAIKGMEDGMFAYFAHPDLFMRSYSDWDHICEEASERICKKASELGIILEYNLAGKMLGDIIHQVQYPHPEFWKIAGKYHCKAIIGVDAHRNMDLEKNDYYEAAIKSLQAFGLQRVETIEFLR